MAIRRRKSSKQFAVIGLGRFGSSVARNLSNMGYEVLAVDVKEESVQELAEVVTQAVQADATDEAAMGALGIRNFDACVIAIGDLQASILATVVAKELGVSKIIAKATSDIHGKVLDKVGATRVVYPERDMGTRVAHNLVCGNVIEYLELAPGYSIVEAKIKKDFVGKTLGQLDFRAKYGITIVAIKRDGEIVVAPGPNDLLLEGDTLVSIGRHEALARLEDTTNNWS